MYEYDCWVMLLFIVRLYLNAEYNVRVSYTEYLAVI